MALINNTNKLWLSLCALLVITGCSSDIFKQMNKVYIDVDVYANSKICNSGSFPNDLLKLCEPFEIETCENFGFIPKVTIYRLDINDSMQVEGSRGLGLLRGSNESKPYKQEKDEIELFLESLKCEEVLSKPTGQNNMSPKVHAGNLVIEYNPENGSKTIDSVLMKIKTSLCHDNLSKEIKVIILYKWTTDLDQDTIVEDTDDCQEDFCREVKGKLLNIATCNTEKVYEDRYELAKEFIAKYISKTTEIELISEEGFAVDYFGGDSKKAADNYILELANPVRCVTHLKIGEFTIDASRKVSFMRIREYGKK